MDLERSCHLAAMRSG